MDRRDVGLLIPPTPVGGPPFSFIPFFLLLLSLHALSCDPPDRLSGGREKERRDLKAWKLASVFEKMCGAHLKFEKANLKHTIVVQPLEKALK